MLDWILNMAAAINTGDISGVADWFSDSFQLHEPGFEIPVGHEGAEVVLRTFLRPDARMRVEILDVIEAGNRAAVR